MRLLQLVLTSVLLFFSLNSHAIEQQIATNWCWAASVQDVIAQTGIIESQPQIAARLTGWPQNRPASIDEVVSLAQSYGLRAWRTGYPGTPYQLLTTLQSGWKLIAFVRPSIGPVGHYIVLEGVDPYGNILTADPATGLTISIPPQALYFAWRWADSVIIGKPMGIESDILDTNIQDANNDDFNRCMSEKIDKCIYSCTNYYNNSSDNCISTLCNPSVGLNQNWTNLCRQ